MHLVEGVDQRHVVQSYYAVLIKCDNENAIKLASNLVFHVRTKHIEVRRHFVRENVLNQEIELKGVKTNDQVADIFT